jgi:RND family efflux transporter MFP subunit
MKTYRIPFCLMTAALLGLTGCGSRQSNKPRLGEVERLPRLETALPERKLLTVSSELAATVEAMEKAELCAQVRGSVKTIAADIDLGRAIKEGEVLITLDIPDLRAELDNKKSSLELTRNLRDQAEQARKVAEQEVKEAEAQIKKYAADVEYTSSQYERMYALSKNGTVQPQLAEEAKLKRDASQAALQVGQTQILTKKARLDAAVVETQVADSRIKVAEAEVARLAAQVSFATISAPFDGVITKRWVDRGAVIKDPGMPLLTVMRTDVVRVIVDVPERDVPHLRVTGKPSAEEKGNQADLRFPALQEALPTVQFKGVDGDVPRVTLLASALDPMSRTMRTEIHLDNKAGHLRPQMTGMVKLQLGRRDHALTIPSSALVRVGNKLEVYHVANPSGTPPRGVVQRAEVELGLDDGRFVEIRKGLTGRELIIVKGNGVVRVGDTAIAVPAR